MPGDLTLAPRDAHRASRAPARASTRPTIVDEVERHFDIHAGFTQRIRATNMQRFLNTLKAHAAALDGGAGQPRFGARHQRRSRPLRRARLAAARRRHHRLAADPDALGRRRLGHRLSARRRRPGARPRPGRQCRAWRHRRRKLERHRPRARRAGRRTLARPPKRHVVEACQRRHRPHPGRPARLRQRLRPPRLARPAARNTTTTHPPRRSAQPPASPTEARVPPPFVLSRPHPSHDAHARTREARTHARHLPSIRRRPLRRPDRRSRPRRGLRCSASSACCAAC